jgi:DNA repair exonuclease SbcCD ATPase subunit
MSETHAEIWSEFDTLRAKLTAQARDVAAMWALIDRLKTRIEMLEKWPDQLGNSLDKLGNSLDKLDCYVARLELRIKEVETWRQDTERQQAQHERAEAYTAGRAMKQE